MSNHKFNNYKNKGLTGLANCGNTCYLNTCIQVLSHTYEISEILEDGSYKSKLNKKPESALLFEWDKLRQLMWSENCTVAPHRFILAVRKVAAIKNRDIFTGYAQNDVNEFFIFLMECFHYALAREVKMSIKGNIHNDIDALATKCYNVVKNMYSKEYSEVIPVFYGVHISILTGVDTNEILGINPEPFAGLDLSIPDNNSNNISLYECLDNYVAKEKLDGYKMDNPRTNEKEEVEKNITFWSFPNILMISLKRFHNNGKKKHILVDAPLDLNLSKYVKGYNKESYIYDLYGICTHSGQGTSGGHYWAQVKNANGKWYKFNDTQVTEIPQNMPSMQGAYCLFYRKYPKIC